MASELQLTRSSQLVDLAWSYRIVLDGQNAGEIRNGATARVPISSGSHTLQVRSLHVVNRHLGLASSSITFDAGQGEKAEFVCRPPRLTRSLAQWITCLRGNRSDWIALDRVTSVD